MPHSWTSWWQKTRERRRARQELKWKRRLDPVLRGALTPVGMQLDQRERLQGLEHRLETHLRLGQQQQAMLQGLVVQPQETQQLLLEIRQAMQPTAEQQLAPLIGALSLTRASPSSRS